MILLRKFVELPSAERRLVFLAAALLPLVRLALLALPWRVVTRALQSSLRHTPTPTHSAERIAWAVRAAGRRVPLGGNCLAQALTACRLLRRDGHRAVLRVGVARDHQRRFIAHAWVECGDTVLLGAPEHRDYVPLPAWEGSA